MGDKYLTRKQIADKLQVVPKTVKNWTDRGILKPHKIGRVVRYVESEVDAALCNNDGRTAQIAKEVVHG